VEWLRKAIDSITKGPPIRLVVERRRTGEVGWHKLTIMKSSTRIHRSPARSESGRS